MTAFDTGFEAPGPSRSLAQIDSTLGSAQSALALAQGAVRTLIERTVSQCRGTLVACQDQVAATVEAELQRQGIALDAIKSSLRAWMDGVVSGAFEYLQSVPGAITGRQMASPVPKGYVPQLASDCWPTDHPPTYPHSQTAPPPGHHYEWISIGGSPYKWLILPDDSPQSACNLQPPSLTATATATVTPTVTSTDYQTGGYTLVNVTTPTVTVTGGSGILVPPGAGGPPFVTTGGIGQPPVGGGGPPVLGGPGAPGGGGVGPPAGGGGAGPPPCLPPAPPAPGWTITGVTTDALGCQQFTYGPITSLGPPIGPGGPPHISFGPPPPPPPIGGGGIIQFGPPPPPPPPIGGPEGPCPITVNVAPSPPCPAPPIQVTCPAPQITNVVNVTPIGPPPAGGGGIGTWPDLGPLANILLNPGAMGGERAQVKRFYGDWLDEFYAFTDDQDLQDVKNAVPEDYDELDLYIGPRTPQEP